MKFNYAEEAVMYLGKKEFFRDFNLDDEQRRDIYRQMYYIINGEPLLVRFSKDGAGSCAELELEPSLGVCLIGGVGIGKTVCFQVMQKLFYRTARQFMLLTSEFFEDCAMNSDLGQEYILERYGYNLQMDLYIDDAGSEKNFKQQFYGRLYNAMEALLKQRERLFVDKGFRTHFSTNVATIYEEQKESDNTLFNIYGMRSFDRIIQMCNIISWEAPSLRSGIKYQEGGAYGL